MPRPVSIIVWRDVKTDPPKKRGYYLADDIDGMFVLHYDPEDEVGYGFKWSDGMGGFPDVRRWAELPVVSDLTDDDVLDAAQHVRHSALSVRNSTAARSRAALSARLRAALGGEKEET